MRIDFEVETFAVQPAVAHAFDARQSDVLQYGDFTGPLDTCGQTIGVLTNVNTRESIQQPMLTSEVTGTLTNAGGHAYPGTTLQDASAHLMLPYASAVRRLTPRECERLMGFPDDYSLVPMPDRRSASRKDGDRRDSPRMMADGPRYKALGNSWAVPVVRWIGSRIDAALRRLDGEA